jgi:hypothetical protein
MSKRRVKITLLCEDKQQEVFARYFLEKNGFKRQDIYIYPIPIGQSGEQLCVRRILMKSESFARLSTL